MSPIDIGLAVGGFIAAIIIVFGGEFMGLTNFFNVKGLINKLKGKKDEDNEAYTKEEFKMFLTADLRLQQLITELRLATGAHRSHIFMFHNGGKYACDTPIRRFSCSHESLEVSSGIQNTQERQNMLTSAFPDKLERIFNPAYEIYMVDDLHGGPCRNYMKAFNTYAFSADSLKYNSLFVGFVGLHWQKEDYDSETLSKYKEAIDKYKPLIEDAMVKKVEAFKKHNKKSIY